MPARPVEAVVVRSRSWTGDCSWKPRQIERSRLFKERINASNIRFGPIYFWRSLSDGPAIVGLCSSQSTCRIV
jgi:hypothetical protein